MWSSRERDRKNCQVVNSSEMWVRFFSTCRACARLLAARCRASKLASGRNHISVDESPTGLSVSGLFRLIFYCSLSSFRRPPACTRSFLPRDRTMHWNSRPLRWAIQSISFSLSLSLFLSFRAGFSVGCLSEKDRGPRTERKSQSFRRRMPFKLFIRISRSWGRAMTGRSNECGVNRLQETQKITSPAWSARGNLIVVAQRAATVGFLKKSSMIFCLDLESEQFCTCRPFLPRERLCSYFREVFK